MNDDSPRAVNNALRQLVIACVKAELQQPYNLGVISREQFVRVCSTVTKEFLRDSHPGQSALTQSNEAHLRARTTALLTKQIGCADSPTGASGEAGMDSYAYDARGGGGGGDLATPHSSAGRSSRLSHADFQQRAAGAAAAGGAPHQQQPQQAQQQQQPHHLMGQQAPYELQHHYQQQPQQDSPSATTRAAAETPGAVLADTDCEVMKYQDHLARLSSLAGRGTPPGSVGRSSRSAAAAATATAAANAAAAAAQPVPQQQAPQEQQLPQQHVYAPSQPVPQQQPQHQQQQGQGVPASTGVSAAHLHADVLAHVSKIEQLQALITSHLDACEAAW